MLNTGPFPDFVRIADPFIPGSPPLWHCPVCNAGLRSVARSGSMLSVTTKCGIGLLTDTLNNPGVLFYRASGVCNPWITTEPAVHTYWGEAC